ncbi:MAG: hypothetical protein ABF629_03130 [Sporolactobacillus sp.]
MFKRMDWPFEIKAMGYNFYVSFCPFLVFLATYFFGDQTLPDILLHQMEFIIAPFSAWWISFLFYGYFEEGGSTFLFSYPLKTIEHGFFRVLLFFLAYVVLIFVCSLLLAVRLYHAPFIALFFQFVSEALVYTSLSFMIINLFKLIWVPLLFIGSYVSTEYLTGGQMIPYYHVMLFHPASIQSSVFPQTLINLGISFIFFLTGHYYLKYKLYA